MASGPPPGPPEPPGGGEPEGPHPAAVGRARPSMLDTESHRVRAVSTRVALAATAIVAVVYAVVAVIVVVIATRNLTAEIDSRLTASLTRLGLQASQLPGTVFRAPPVGPRFAPPLIIWTVHPGGFVTSTDSETAAALPDDLRVVASPETVSIGGTDVRVAGATIGSSRVIVGQTMESVAKARSNVVLAEVLVGPVLLAMVFLGALAIGRRTALPFERARRRQMDFTADASHELRTPLAVIEAQTSLALTQDRDSAWYQRAFQRVDFESKRIRRLVEDLLWLARFDSTRGQPHAELVDLGVLAGQAVDRFAGIAEARGLRLDLLAAGDGATLTAPPEWLDRLLAVLLDNACKYAPAGGAVLVRVEETGSDVRIGVEDSGPGIPPDQRARIFDRFHRASDQPGGAGLGLAIADAVVQATCGRWEVGSSALGGTSMVVSWPRGMAAVRRALSPLGRGV